MNSASIKVNSCKLSYCSLSILGKGMEIQFPFDPKNYRHQQRLASFPLNQKLVNFKMYLHFFQEITEELIGLTLYLLKIIFFSLSAE